MVSWCKKGEYNAQNPQNQSYVEPSGQTIIKIFVLKPAIFQLLGLEIANAVGASFWRN